MKILLIVLALLPTLVWSSTWEFETQELTESQRMRIADYTNGFKDDEQFIHYYECGQGVCAGHLYHRNRSNIKLEWFSDMHVSNANYFCVDTQAPGINEFYSIFADDGIDLLLTKMKMCTDSMIP